MSVSKDEYKMFTYLGQKIKNTYLKESACINPEIRRQVGYARAYELLTGDLSFDDFIEALKIVGWYTWPRMEVSDLSLMLGENIRRVNFTKPDTTDGNTEAIHEDSEEDI